MNAKIQKEYRIIIGTNDDKVTIEDIDSAACKMEQEANENSNFRFHLLTKDEEGD